MIPTNPVDQPLEKHDPRDFWPESHQADKAIHMEEGKRGVSPKS